LFARTQAEATCLRKTGDFSGAVALYEEALKFARINKDENRQLTCLLNLGILFWNLGQLKDSAGFYSEAMSFADKLDLKSSQDECRGALGIYETYTNGKALRLAGRYKESIAQFEIAIELARKIKSPEHELKCLRQLSLNYFNLERLEEYFLLNQKALELAGLLNHRQEEGRCLNQIGIYYWRLNKYSRALSYYENALAISLTLNKNEKDRSDYLNNMGIVYRDIGNYDRALRYLKEALEIDRRLGDDNSISADLNNMGAVFRSRGEFQGDQNDFKRSLDYYVKSFEISRRKENIGLEIESLNNIGLAYAAIDDLVSSLKYFELAQDKASKINDIYELGNIFINTGNVYLQLKDYKKSKKYFQKGLELSLKSEKNEALWEAYFGLGQCFEIEQQYASALTCYKKAVNNVDHIRSQLSVDDYKAGFARDKLKVYESLIHLLFMLKMKGSTSRYDEEIFQVIEKAKARSFLESLIEMDNSSLESLPPEFKKEQAEISKKITLTISGLTKSAITDDQRRILLERLENEENAYMSLLNKMKLGKQTKSGLTSIENMSIEKVQNQLLDRKTAIIEFFLGEEESFVFLITKEDFILRSLPSRASIENSLRAYLKTLSTYPNRKFQGGLAAKRLYNDFLCSFEETISPFVEHLIIVPDGVLYYLPFEALISEAKGTHPKQKYLIELYRISYAPSASSLVFLVNKKTEVKALKLLLAVGDPDYSAALPHCSKQEESYGDTLREVYLNNGFDFSSLPHTKDEVLQISRYFPRDKVDICMAGGAREDVIKKKSLKDYRIIHFACHGFQDERFPLRSALVLSLSDNVQEDGFLQVREIHELRLNADLVVLSACQTGRGKLENGEGVMGLPRVFFYAGAKSTISTLWKINDRSTSELMRYFYRYLSNGGDKAQALRLAKLKMIKSNFSHPFFWAGFVLNGDYSSRFVPE